MLHSFILKILTAVAERLGMKLVPVSELIQLETDLDRAREATDEVAQNMFVIIATSGPKAGTFTPIPLPHVNAIPHADPSMQRGNRSLFTTPSGWRDYQQHVETLTPADRRESRVSGLVVPKATAIAYGYVQDKNPEGPTYTLPNQ